ncbi:SRSF protein kinase 1-like isoform X2 [Agrilus planipennis]|uniref:non-specific serine/threonine protein kinase n=1 Tax=Agrilus planipennis TaxID=224129 RepID=A0A1W4WT28_AGRPL|nr:SRSF protein kinase 1-like isoform X2 [Agrilus planipennis]
MCCVYVIFSNFPIVTDHTWYNDSFCPRNFTTDINISDFESLDAENILIKVILSQIIIFIVYLLIQLASKYKYFHVIGQEQQICAENKASENLSREPIILKLISISVGPIICRDIVKNSSEYSKIVGDHDDHESIDDYGIGGYMPVQPQQILHRKYKVLRKLGFGHFSTVWLCENIHDKSYLAVKIVKAASAFCEVATDEIKILGFAMGNDRNHIGRKHIVEFFCNFTETSVNGPHVCMGFELMGPSLYRLIVQSDFQGIQLSGVRSIMKQVLRGLVYLHNSCRIIHTDLKPENILITVNECYIRKLVDAAYRCNREKVPNECENEDYDDFEELNFRRNKSYPEDDFMSALEGHASRHTREVGLYSPMWVDPNIQVKIADLGNACWADKHYSHEIQTMQYRALEVILGANYSFAADMWSVGCIAFELATGEYLFCPKTKANYSSNDDHIALIWELLDGIPKYITKRGINSHLYFTSEGKLRNIPESQMRIWKLENVLIEKYKWRKLDAIWFSGFILSLIEPDPDLRSKASTALTNEWLQTDDSS